MGKSMLGIIAFILLLSACAPSASQVTPAAQPAQILEPQPVAAPAEEQMPPESSLSGKTVDVEIKGFAFHPAVITVQAGDTVRWTNQDSAPHDAAGTGWTTQTPLRKGESDTVTFDKPGEYDYICSIHPNMKAKVIVK
jgi:plastocyanin